MEMKICSICEKEQSIDNFSLKSSKTEKRRTYCRICQAAYSRKHYENNTAEMKRRARQHKDEMASVFRKQIFQYLLEHPCVDCGESDPVCLEFDHIQGSKKENIASMISGGYSWRIIEAEIAKCVVRCANCHRRKTAKQLGWYRAIQEM